MVLLSFSIKVKAPLKEVWDYFSKFERIQEWDPNVKKSRVGKVFAGKIGNTYDLVTVFKGRQSQITYTLIEHRQLTHISVRGRNNTITAEDHISFWQLDYGVLTEITYEAIITLNHILCCCQCLIREDLRKLAVYTEQGMRERCREIFGNNSC